VCTLQDSDLVGNRKDPLLSGLIACGAPLKPELMNFLSSYLQPVAEK